MISGCENDDDDEIELIGMFDLSSTKFSCSFNKRVDPTSLTKRTDVVLRRPQSQVSFYALADHSVISMFNEMF